MGFTTEYGEERKGSCESVARRIKHILHHSSTWAWLGKQMLCAHISKEPKLWTATAWEMLFTQSLTSPTATATLEKNHSSQEGTISWTPWEVPDRLQCSGVLKGNSSSTRVLSEAAYIILLCARQSTLTPGEEMLFTMPACPDLSGHEALPSQGAFSEHATCLREKIP